VHSVRCWRRNQGFQTRKLENINTSIEEVLAGRVTARLVFEF